MKTYVFAQAINGVKEMQGIINTKTQMVLCVCNQENAKFILNAIEVTYHPDRNPDYNPNQSEPH